MRLLPKIKSLKRQNTTFECCSAIVRGPCVVEEPGRTRSCADLELLKKDRKKGSVEYGCCRKRRNDRLESVAKEKAKARIVRLSPRGSVGVGIQAHA